MDIFTGDEAKSLIGRRHEEWKEHEVLWRRTLDSLEGGDSYRNTVYQVDPNTGEYVRNLIRHKKELPDPVRPGSYGQPPYTGYYDQRFNGEDPNAHALESEYQNRLSRTPVPSLFCDAVRKLVSRLFSKEVVRDIPDGPAFGPLRDWTADVDGRGTSLDEWLAEEVGELFLALGQIDVQAGRPPMPAEAGILSRADESAAGLDRVIASVILPQNMLWWRTDFEGRYLECLVKEFHEDTLGKCHPYYRHWTPDASVLYQKDGTLADVGEGRYPLPHPYGEIPIRRIFDRRKVRCRNVGQGRVGAVLDLEREYYNVDSELILSNSLQAHPTLQGPPAESSSEVTVGPGYVLQKQLVNGREVVGYDYLDPPKGAAEFLQTYKEDLLSRIDRITCQTKPAGAAGTGSTVAQSGISKAMDQRDGNDLLSKIGRSFARLELEVLRLVMLVAADGRPDGKALESLKVTYPSGFNLLAADDLANLGVEWAAWLDTVGKVPEVEKAFGRQFLSLMLPGQDDASFEAQAEALDQFIDDAARDREQAAEGLPGPGQPQGANPAGTDGPVPPQTTASQSLEFGTNRNFAVNETTKL